MSNIVNDLVEEYIRETLAEKDGLLKELEDYAHENSVPIIHKEVSDLLKVILKIHRPKRILEIGCAIGYSSIFFASVLGGDVEIITTERNEVMIEKSKTYLFTYTFKFFAPFDTPLKIKKLFFCTFYATFK